MIKEAHGRADRSMRRTPSRGLGITTPRPRAGRAANDNHRPLGLRLARWPVIVGAAIAVVALYCSIAVLTG